MRRLAAILVADVVGFSRLMGQDEVGTLARLKALRVKVLEPLIAEHRGRVVKLMGDGLLVEFASVVDAMTAPSPGRSVSRNGRLGRIRMHEFSSESASIWET